MARAEEIRGCSPTLLYPLALEVIPEGIPPRVYEANLHTKFALYKRCSRPKDEWYHYVKDVEIYITNIPVHPLLPVFAQFLAFNGNVGIVDTSRHIPGSSNDVGKPLVHDRKFHNKKQAAKDRRNSFRMKYYS